MPCSTARFRVNKKLVANKGIVPQYYVENSHEAIIPRDLFLQVQEEMVQGPAGDRHRKAASLQRKVCAFPPCLLRSLRRHLPQDPVVDSRRIDLGLALHQPDREKKSKCGLPITDYLREGYARGGRDCLQPADRSEG